MEGTQTVMREYLGVLEPTIDLGKREKSLEKSDT
jgi:hypothetical protein